MIAEIKTAVVMNWRYKLNLISSWMLYTVIFGVLIFAVRGYDGKISVDGSGIVIGYAVWMLALSVTGGFANKIQAWSEEGVLEQIFMTPVSPVSLLIFNQIGNLLTQIVGFVIVIWVLAFFSGTQLFWSVGVIVTIIMTMVGVMGIGFIAGAVTLLTKKAYGIGLIVEFLLLGLSMIPSSVYAKLGPAMQLLPYAPGMRIVCDVFTNRTGFSSMIGRADFWIFFLNSWVYFAVGIYVFSLSLRLAKNKGLLAGY